MANKTTNYNLTKPSAEDFYNIDDHNGNMDIIDAELNNLDKNKAPSGHGVGKAPNANHNVTFKSIMQKGCGFYQVDVAEDNPVGSNAWMCLLQFPRDGTPDNETGVQLVLSDKEVKPQMWLRAMQDGAVSNWVEMLHTGNLHQAGVPKIVTGSYVGNGNHGKSSPTSITFDFEPKLVILNGVVTAIRGMSEVQYYSTQLRSLKLTWSGNTLTWYCTEGASWQFNSSNTTYHWAAIG